MRKTLTYSTFIIASTALVAAFLTATSYLQLGVAVLVYPLVAYFAFKIMPRKSWKAPVLTIDLPVPGKSAKAEIAKAEAAKPVDISDIDKRAFLKLIGAAGLSFFIFSLINRRAEGLFMSRSGIEAPTGPIGVKDTQDRQINPAENHPTDGYRISEIDDNIITYYGFTNKDGAWFVIREDTENGSFRYSRGDINFSMSWKNRESLPYDYYNNVF